MIEQKHGDKKHLEEMYNREKDDLYYQYSWSSYRVNVLGIEDADTDLKLILDEINKQEDNMKNLGYILVINNYYPNESNSMI